MWNFLVVRCDNQRLGTVILRQEWRFNSRHKIGKVLFNQPHYSGSIDRIGIFIHGNDDNDPLGLRLSSSVTGLSDRRRSLTSRRDLNPL